MFDAYIAHHARLRPSAPAIVVPGASVSFAALDACVTRAARLLRVIEAPADQPVAVDVRDQQLAWLLTLALARLGIPSAPGIDTGCELRISDRADDDATFVIGQPELATILSGPVQPLPRPTCEPNRLGRVLPSSGTTGSTKRIALDWRTIDAGIRNVPIAYGGAGGPWLMATGIHTILGFVLTLGCWALGKAVVIGLDREPDETFLQAMGPGLLAMTPMQIGRLVDGLTAGHPKQPIRIVTGGGPIPPTLLARTRRALTDDIVSVYGASECGAVAVADAALLDRAPNATGIVLPGVTVEIVSDLGRPVTPGAIGHVRVRSDRVASGYIDGPAAAFRDGWFWPGDLGRMDADGLLVLEGRADDLMNLGGEKIVPGWIEDAARLAPGILDVAAFSLPDPDGWERCWLAIVAGEDFEEQALTAALSGQVALVHTLHWFRVASLPRNAMGKVERNRLRQSARLVQAERLGRPA